MSPTTADLDNLAAGIFGIGVTFSSLSPVFQNLLLFTWETLLYASISPATATAAQSNAAWTYTLPFVFGVAQANGTSVNELLNQSAWAAGAPGAIPGGRAPSSPPNIIVTQPFAPAAPGATPPPPSPTPTPTPTPTPSPTPTPVLGPPHSLGSIGDYCSLFPNDPVCQGQIGGDFPPTIVIIDNPGTTIVGGVNITITGPNGADVTSAVDGALGDLWDATVGAVDTVLADAINGIQSVLTSIGNALKAAWNILSHLSGLILGFLQHLLAEVVQGILKVLIEARNLAENLYKKVLLPIAQGVINVRNALMDVYQRFIRPMLIVLQDIRKVLSILAAFHVGFASKLDAKLADLESRITRPFLYVLSFVNAVSNWINLIITAGYLLQKSVLLNSLAAYIGELLNLQLNAMNQPVSSAGVAAAAAANTVPTASQASTDLQHFIGSNSGPMPGGLQPYVNQLNGYLSTGPF